MSSARDAADREASGSRRNQLVVVLATVILVVAVTLVIVAVTDGGGTLTPDSEQYRAVQVDGAPLVPFGGDTLGDPALGAMAPVITGASFDGSPVVIGPGSPTLVVFLAHWCPHCQAEVPMLVEWAESLRVPFGLDVFAVAVRAPHPTARTIRHRSGWNASGSPSRCSPTTRQQRPRRRSAPPDSRNS